jgi:hypothetical protein
MDNRYQNLFLARTKLQAESIVTLYKRTPSWREVEQITCNIKLLKAHLRYISESGITNERASNMITLINTVWDILSTRELNRNNKRKQDEL